MLKITNLRNGTVLNTEHGRERGNRLEIVVAANSGALPPITALANDADEKDPAQSTI